MKQAQVTLIASNSEAFPAGSRVWAQQEQSLRTKLADHDVEDITYFPSAQRIDVRTVLGYQFSISTADYHRLVPE
jgi:hypothetical protein